MYNNKTEKHEFKQEVYMLLDQLIAIQSGEK